jgi:hypothetical protein
MTPDTAISEKRMGRASAGRSPAHHYGTRRLHVVSAARRYLGKLHWHGESSLRLA